MSKLSQCYQYLQESHVQQMTSVPRWTVITEHHTAKSTILPCNMDIVTVTPNVSWFVLFGVLRRCQHYYSHISATVHLFMIPGVNTPVLGLEMCLAQGHSIMTTEPRLGIEPGTPGSKLMSAGSSSFRLLWPPRWCSGRASASGAESCAFDPRPGHTKVTFKQV